MAHFFDMVGGNISRAISSVEGAQSNESGSKTVCGRIAYVEVDTVTYRLETNDKDDERKKN